MYTIKYAGGEFVSVGQNGNLFLSASELPAEMSGKVFREVRITGNHDEDMPDLSGSFDLMICSYCHEGDGVHEFVLEPYDAAEMRLKRIEGNLEYLAMMGGIEL